MNTKGRRLLGYGTAILFTACLSIPAVSAETCEYSIVRSYDSPVTSVRTYSTRVVPTSTTFVPTTTFNGVVESPVVIQRSPVVLHSAPVFVERAPQSVVIEQASRPVVIERTVERPVIVEKTRPIKVKSRKDSHHLLNFGVWPLVKLKVL